MVCEGHSMKDEDKVNIRASTGQYKVHVGSLNNISSGYYNTLML